MRSTCTHLPETPTVQREFYPGIRVPGSVESITMKTHPGSLRALRRRMMFVFFLLRQPRFFVECPSSAPPETFRNRITDGDQYLTHRLTRRLQTRRRSVFIESCRQSTRTSREHVSLGLNPAISSAHCRFVISEKKKEKNTPSIYHATFHFYERKIIRYKAGET